MFYQMRLTIEGMTFLCKYAKGKKKKKIKNKEEKKNTEFSLIYLPRYSFF